jgi:antitoxin (DNA-binding transcriptional repressor) of toxin-antitoxin stability system
MTKISISEAASQLEDLVRRVAHERETIALTDHGYVAALLVPPQVIEDLEDSLAVAGYERRKAEGTLEPGVPMAEVRRRLGLRPPYSPGPDRLSTGSRNSSRLPTGS